MKRHDFTPSELIHNPIMMPLSHSPTASPFLTPKRREVRIGLPKTMPSRHFSRQNGERDWSGKGILKYPAIYPAKLLDRPTPPPHGKLKKGGRTFQSAIRDMPAGWKTRAPLREANQASKGIREGIAA